MKFSVLYYFMLPQGNFLFRNETEIGLNSIMIWLLIYEIVSIKSEALSPQRR